MQPAQQGRKKLPKELAVVISGVFEVTFVLVSLHSAEHFADYVLQLVVQCSGMNAALHCFWGVQ